MYPNEIISGTGIDLYIIMLLIGILVCLFVLRYFSDKMKLPYKVFVLSLFTAIAAIVVGYISSLLFQSVYHLVDTGVWLWGVGSTFYGGLIGAIISYLLIYFVAGHFVCKDKEHIREFNNMLCCIFPCIVIAHAFGRIGCLFAGCCHGAETDSWIGIDMWHRVGGEWVSVKYVPIQLFEAIFLFALFAFMTFMLLKKKNEYITSIYLIGYGVWRFVIEYFRDDDRGSSGISWLSPSQLTAIIMVVAGVALIFVYKNFLKSFLPNIGIKSESGGKKIEGA